MATKLWVPWLTGIVRATTIKDIFLKTCSTLFQPRSLLAHGKPSSRTKRRFLFFFLSFFFFFCNYYTQHFTKKTKLEKEIFDCAAQYLCPWTRGWTHASCSGRVESKPLEHQGSPKEDNLECLYTRSKASREWGRPHGYLSKYSHFLMP